MKITFWVYLIGAMALAGIPPLAGFWSKDEILAESASTLNVDQLMSADPGCLFTAFYMARQVLMVFFGKPRSPAAEHAQESPPIMTVPLIVLACFRMFGRRAQLARLAHL